MLKQEQQNELIKKRFTIYFFSSIFHLTKATKLNNPLKIIMFALSLVCLRSSKITRVRIDILLATIILIGPIGPMAA